MSEKRKCVMCGSPDHLYQDGEECPDLLLANKQEYSERAKKGWQTRKQKKDE